MTTSGDVPTDGDDLRPRRGGAAILLHNPGSCRTLPQASWSCGSREQASVLSSLEASLDEAGTISLSLSTSLRSAAAASTYRPLGGMPFHATSSSAPVSRLLCLAST